VRSRRKRIYRSLPYRPTGLSPLEAGDGEPVNWRRAIQVGLGLAVLAMAVLALATSALVVPEPGVVTSDPGLGATVVLNVDPGSPAWRDHLRPGNQVLDLQGSDDPGGWRMVVRDGSGAMLESSTTAQVDVLRSHVPWSMTALAVASIAALLAYRRRAAASVILPIAMLVAAQPLFLSGSLAAEILAGVAVCAGGALAAVAFATWRRLLVVPLIAGLALAAAQVGTILAAPDAFDGVDAARVPLAAGLSTIALASVLDRRRVVEFLTGRGGPAFVDVLYLGLAVALVLAGILGIVPLVPAIVVTGVAIAAYPAWRRATIAALDGLVTTQARRDAAIRAVEGERSRLAREIHDAPLQELSGVIRRLETVPGAEHEADTLREVAGQLRDVATTLHPPVLQDLGLAASLEDLGDQLSVTAPDWRVSVEVDDLTGTGRPRPEVELAAFRVAQEASSNAIAHSGGHHLGIAGSVASEAIELSITDDGHGLSEEDARSARRTGHFGLDSMRERAEAVGASTSIATSGQGVLIRFHWECRR
jgi:signal transduction histidine kinase